MSLRETLLAELDELRTLIGERKEEIVRKCEGELQEIQSLRERVVQGQGTDEVRLKLRAIRQRNFGNEDPKRAKNQDMRVRMRAPSELIGTPGPKHMDKGNAARPSLSRVVVSGSIQRELATIEGRMVSLLVDEGQTQAAEVCFLADLRAGLVGLQRELPEHNLLLSLVNEHLEGVDATLKDLAAGGVLRAKRFFEHDRELLGRLKAMILTEGKKSPGATTVEKLSESLQRARKSLDLGGADLPKTCKELEQTLMTIHGELQGLGFVAAKSLLFNGLRS